MVELFSASAVHLDKKLSHKLTTQDDQGVLCQSLLKRHYEGDWGLCNRTQVNINTMMLEAGRGTLKSIFLMPEIGFIRILTTFNRVEGKPSDTLLALV